MGEPTRRGGSSTAQNRTEQNLRLLEALGSSAPKGIITSTLAMGFGCAMELNQWFYAPTPQ
jgi:hypothetical protein